MLWTADHVKLWQYFPHLSGVLLLFSTLRWRGDGGWPQISNDCVWCQWRHSGTWSYRLKNCDVIVSDDHIVSLSMTRGPYVFCDAIMLGDHIVSVTCAVIFSHEHIVSVTSVTSERQVRISFGSVVVTWYGRPRDSAGWMRMRSAGRQTETPVGCSGQQTEWFNNLMRDKHKIVILSK